MIIVLVCGVLWLWLWLVLAAWAALRMAAPDKEPTP